MRIRPLYIFIVIAMFFSADALFAQQQDVVYIVDSLKEVLVTRDKEHVKIGNDGSLIFDAKKYAENSIIENALDFLDEIPVITRDENSYSLIGGGVAAITINGRVNSMSQEQILDFLSTVEPNMVKNIRVFYRTPAQSGVHGASIDIELEQRRSHELNISGAAKTTMYQARKFYPLGYIYGFLEDKKWSLDMNYAIGQGKKSRINNSYVTHDLPRGTHEVEMEDKLLQDGLAQRFTATLNFDLKGGVLAAGYYFRKDDQDTDKPYSATDNGNEYFWGEAPLHSKNKNNLAFVDYKKGKLALGVSSNITDYDSHQPNEIHFPSKQDFTIETDAHQKAKTYNAYFSNTNAIEYGEFSYGVELTNNIVTTSQSTSVDTRGDGDNTFSTEHFDTEVSTFVGWSQKIGSKLFLNAELAMKYQVAEQETDNGKKESLWDRVLILPGLDLSYKVNDHNALSLAVASASNYPTYVQGSPRINNSNYYFSSVGNPELKPEQIYQIRLNYVLNGAYTFGLFGNIAKDKITQYFIPSASEARGYYYFTNFDTFNSVGLSASAIKVWSNRFNQRWSGQISEQIAKGKIEDIDIDKTNTNFTTSLVSNFVLNRKKTLLYSVTLLYNGQSLSPSMVYKPAFEARMSASYRLPKYGWEFTLRGNDILGTANSKFKSGIPGHIADFKNDTDSQSVIFTAKYTWRGYKEKKEKAVNNSRTGL